MRMAMSWFKLNEMVASSGKFQLILFQLKEGHELSNTINGNIIKTSDTVKLLGVAIDSKLKYNEHVKIICQKTNSKVKALSRIVRHFKPRRLAYYVTRL